MEPKEQSVRPRGKIIALTAHAPVIYLISFFLGVLAHYFYPVTFIPKEAAGIVGSIFLVAGPLLILWSQVSIRRFRREVAANRDAQIFNIGPYRLTRNPTYLGLTLLITGFGFLANSLFIVLSGIVGFITVNYTIVRSEESLLREKYGEHYERYKEKVRRWL